MIYINPIIERRIKRIKKFFKINPQINDKCLYLYNLGNNDRHIALKLNKKFSTTFSADEIRFWRKINKLPVTGTHGSLSCIITDRIGDKIISMLKDGNTIEEISFELGISFATLKGWIWKHQIPAKKLSNFNRKETIIKLFKTGHSDKEIAQIVGGTPRAIYQWRRTNNYT